MEDLTLTLGYRLTVTLESAERMGMGLNHNIELGLRYSFPFRSESLGRIRRRAGATQLPAAPCPPHSLNSDMSRVLGADTACPP